MLDWLSKLDPNLALTILGAIGGGVVWLYRDVTGQKQESLADLASGAARSVWTGVLASYAGGSVSDFQAKVQAKITDAIWTELAKHGVKTGDPVLSLMVNTVVQHAVADATDALNDAINAQVQQSLDKLTANAASIQKTLATAVIPPGAVPIVAIPGSK